MAWCARSVTFGREGHSIYFVCSLAPEHPGAHVDEWWHFDWEEGQHEDTH